MKRAALALLVVVGALGCPVAVPDLLVVPFCDLPAANCEPCEDDICLGLEPQVWCCDKIGDGGCTPADALTECDQLNQYAVWCEHGQSIPVTNPDGTAGFECFG